MGQYSQVPLFSQDPQDIADVNAAKRLSDIVNNICISQPLDVVLRSWIAVSLADGSTDGVLYESRRAAVTHQYHETQCAYLCLKEAPHGMPTQDAYVYLKYHRDAYLAGMRLIDPEKDNGGYDLRMPIAREDVSRHIAALNRKVR
jgi:hypothetical protein